MPWTSKSSTLVDGPCAHVALYSSVLTPTFSSCIDSQRDYVVPRSFLDGYTGVHLQIVNYVYGNMFIAKDITLTVFLFIFLGHPLVSPDWYHCHRQWWHWAVAADCSQQLSLDTAFSPSGVWVGSEKDSPESKFLRMLPDRSHRKSAWVLNTGSCWRSLWWTLHYWALHFFGFKADNNNTITEAGRGGWE